MLRLAIVFFVIALIAAVLGFYPIEGMAFFAAKILFFVFLVLAVLSLLGNVFSGGADHATSFDEPLDFRAGSVGDG